VRKADILSITGVPYFTGILDHLGLILSETIAGSEDFFQVGPACAMEGFPEASEAVKKLSDANTPRHATKNRIVRIAASTSQRHCVKCSYSSEAGGGGRRFPPAAHLEFQCY
jgi:hypothetical protein